MSVINCCLQKQVITELHKNICCMEYQPHGVLHAMCQYNNTVDHNTIQNGSNENTVTNLVPHQSTTHNPWTCVNAATLHGESSSETLQSEKRSAWSKEALLAVLY